jgi:molybdate transport system permease protein
LFDEPFSALDTPRRRRLQRSLRELQREISAVTIIVTHDPDEAALLADELLVIDQGRLLQSGPTEQVFERPASMRVAELLGLRNVGEGVVSSPGSIRVGNGLMLQISDVSLAVGQRVMWRVPSRAIQPSQDGPLVATVDSIELRDGERFARLDIEGVHFDIAAGSFPVCEGDAIRCCVEAAAVSAWSESPIYRTPQEAFCSTTR